MEISIKTFKELTKEELYNILKLRSEVFVVEQNCVYQDIDDKDQNALHTILKKDKIIIGYTRIFKPGDYFEYASIGRVVIKNYERHNSYGSLIMISSIKAIQNQFKTNTIKISAQKHLSQFYKNLGFNEVGEGYLEDGIPHIVMIKN